MPGANNPARARPADPPHAPFEIVAFHRAQPGGKRIPLVLKGPVLFGDLIVLAGVGGEVQHVMGLLLQLVAFHQQRRLWGGLVQFDVDVVDQTVQPAGKRRRNADADLIAGWQGGDERAQAIEDRAAFRCAPAEGSA